MRVLYVHSGNLFGGVETLMLTLAKHRDLCPEMEPHFALCFEGRFSQELKLTGAPLYPLGSVRISKPLSVRKARQNLRKILKVIEFDVVVTHSCWTQAIFGPTVRKEALPLVFYMHAPTERKHWLERWAGKTLPDMVVCNSQFTATCTRLYSGVRSETIYCPISPANGTCSDIENKRLRSELGTANDAVVIIQVGRLERSKGQLQHLEALSLLKDLPNWVCWQVGGPQRPGEAQYLEDLKSAARRLGIYERVHFLGERSDVPQLMSAADIYCQPNVGADSFGITLIEALYAELPVVATRLGGALEIVDGSCGVLVPPDEINLLATTLRNLFQDKSLRRRLGNAGMARAASLVDPSVRMNDLHDAFNAVINQRSVSLTSSLAAAF